MALQIRQERYSAVAAASAPRKKKGERQKTAGGLLSTASTSAPLSRQGCPPHHRDAPPPGSTFPCRASPRPPASVGSGGGARGKKRTAPAPPARQTVLGRLCPPPPTGGSGGAQGPRPPCSRPGRTPTRPPRSCRRRTRASEERPQGPPFLRPGCPCRGAFPSSPLFVRSILGQPAQVSGMPKNHATFSVADVSSLSLPPSPPRQDQECLKIYNWALGSLEDHLGLPQPHRRSDLQCRSLSGCFGFSYPDLVPNTTKARFCATASPREGSCWRRIK